MNSAMFAHAQLSPLARQFGRFCVEIDPSAPMPALLAAVLAAEADAHGDVCLELAAWAGRPALHDEHGNVLAHAPPLKSWLASLHAKYIQPAGKRAPLILDGTRLYLYRHHRAERAIAADLLARSRPHPVDGQWLKTRLDALFGPLTAQDPGWWQRLAAAMAVSSGLCVISGGPGTGKTTTIRRILALLRELEPHARVLLAAPTGKAATRLNQTLGTSVSGQAKAVTLHRLLQASRFGFGRDREQPLTCDCLIVDECSMVDQGLMHALLEALPTSSRLILVGDRNQLSSVESGSIFGDLTGRGLPMRLSRKRAQALSLAVNGVPETLVAEDAVPVRDCIVELRHSFRFDASGRIGQLAKALEQKNASEFRALMEKGDAALQWVFSEGPDLLRPVLDWMRRRYAPIFNAENADEALACFERARVLCALREGPWGEASLRRRFQESLTNFPTADERPMHGLPILILRNDPETGLANGDTGIFWESPEGLQAWFRIEGIMRNFHCHDIPSWQPAWSLTVHRSQGSEYDDVLLVLPPEDHPLVGRELIYTAVTRARHHCTIVGNPQAMLRAMPRSMQRASGLYERLGWPKT